VEWAREAYGLSPLETAAGCAAFDAALAGAEACTLVLSGDAARLRTALALAPAAAATLTVPATAPQVAAPTPPAGERTSNWLEDYLKGLLVELLKLSPGAIRPRESFDRYGLDSVSMLEITARLEAMVGPLPKTLLYEYDNLADLARHLHLVHGERLRAHAPAAATPAFAASASWRADAAMPVSDPLPVPATASAQVGAPLTAGVPIAIIGVAGRYPGADNLDAFWDNLAQGRDSVSEIPADRWAPEAGLRRWGGLLADVDKFDAEAFRISPREAASMDPQERLFLETAWHCLEDAGYASGTLAKHDVGVFVGVMWADYQLFGPQLAAQGNPILPGAPHASIANRLSYFFDWRGPSMAVDTMCSSSLSAIHLACAALRDGDCATALAGGVNLSLHPQKYRQLEQGNFTSRDGRCRSFGEGGDGYVPGEGVGAVLLKRLDQALADGDQIHAVILGSAVNHGGKTSAYTVPSPSAQAAAITRAVQKAGVDPASISYVEAHGTGTALGDPIEISALARAFDGACACAIGSVKSNIGHLEGAAGIAGLTKLILQLRHGMLAPSLHAARLNPHIDFGATPFHVQRELAPWRSEGPRRAGLSSFGAGGANAHLIVEQAPAQPAHAQLEGPFVVLLSAHAEPRLVEIAAQLARFVAARRDAGPALSLGELAYTLQLGREPLRHRLALVVATLEQLEAMLERFVAGERGQGAAYTGKNDAAGALLDGDAGAAFLRAVLERRDLDRAAQLWVAGAGVDWRGLYAGAAPRRISLPGYPFQRRRCWFEAAAAAQPSVPQPSAPLPRLPALPQLQRDPAPAAAPANVVVAASAGAPKLVLRAPALAAEAASHPLGGAVGLLRLAPASASASVPVAAAAAPAPHQAPAGTASTGTVYQSVRSALADVLMMTEDEIDDDRSFNDLGVDSVIGVELIQRLNRVLGLEAEATRLYDHPSVTRLSAYLDGLAPAAQAAAPSMVAAPAAATVAVVVAIPAGATAATQPEVKQEAMKQEAKTMVLSEVRNELAAILMMEEDELDDARAFNDLGLDSVLGVELISRLNQRLGLAVKATVLYDHATLARLARHLGTLVAMPAAPAPQPTAPAPAVARPADDAIAIIGMSGKFAGADDLDAFWRNLRDGVDSVREVPAERWSAERFYDPDPMAAGKTYCKDGGFVNDVAAFDALFFNISPADAEVMDPQQRLFLEAAWSSFEDAGYGPEMLSGARCGAYVGVMGNEYLSMVGERRPAQAMLGNSASILPARIAYLLNLKGATMALDTACSSSLVAIHHACSALRAGEADMMLAGGVALYLTEQPYISMSKGGMLSPDGRCKAFDNGANGFVPGEGVGVVLLKRFDQALRDGDPIHAVIIGSGVNQDGSTNGITAPSADSQRDLALAVYQRFAIDPSTITYVEAHGTGTRLGDPIEVDALTQAFRRHTGRTGFCRLGSVKSNIGHASAAAGVAGLIKIVQSMRHGQIAPTLHLGAVNDHIDFVHGPFVPATSLGEWKPEPAAPLRAALSAFGFSGTNGHAVVEAYAHAGPAGGAPGPQLVVLSARTAERLKVYARALLDGLAQRPALTLPSLAYTLQVGRIAQAERLAMVVGDLAELRQRLEAFCTDAAPGGWHRGRAKGGRAAPVNLAAADAAADFAGLDRLALAWTGGGGVDWRALHGAQPPRRASLPTYPFARERHWVTPAAVGPAATGAAAVAAADPARLHPLLQRDVSVASAPCFESRFSGDEAILADHRLHGRAVMPGAALIEMALAAGETARRQTVHAIEDVVWLKPLVPDAHGALVSVQLDLDAGDGSGMLVRIGSDGAPQPYASARLRFAPPLAAPAPVDVGGLRRRCAEPVDVAALHARLGRSGLVYGPSLQTIVGLGRGAGEALAELELQPGESPAVVFSQPWTLHPALLDGALRAIGGLASDAQRAGASGAPVLPLGIGLVQVFARLPARCLAHVRAATAAPEDLANGVLSFDMDLLDAGGEVLAALRAVRLQAGLGALDPDATVVAHKAWRDAGAIVAPPAPGGARAPILLFDTDAQRVAAFEAACGGPVVLVTPGEHYARHSAASYTVKAGRFDDYRRLVAALWPGAGGPQCIVFLWGADGAQAAPGTPAAPDLLALQMEHSVYAVTALVQALTRHGRVDGLRLLYAHGAGVPAHAAVAALARTLRLEFPRLRSAALELADDADPVASANAELGLMDAPQVRHAGGRRWIAFMQAGSGVQGTPPQRHGGVYLIAGGAGGIGQVIAGHLARRWGARVTLVGRSALQPEALADLAALAAATPGAEVRYVQADICRPDQMAAVVAGLQARHGALHGVLHAAGVLRDGLVQHRSPRDMACVLAPKVLGVAVLDAATASAQLDFFVCFASLAGVLGNLGQSDYAYANAFLDGFAEWREAERASGRRSGRAQSLAWPLWEGLGMGGTEGAQKIETLVAALGLAPVTAAMGVDAFERMLGASQTTQLFLAGESEALAALLGWPAPQAPADAADPAPGLDQAGLAGLLADDLRVAAARLLKIALDEIDLELELTRYGVDSIGFAEFANYLTVTFGIAVPPMLVFEYSSIRALSDYLVGRFGAQLSAHYHAVAAPAATAAAAPVAVAAAERQLRLSHGQQALWFLHAVEPASAAYHVALQMRLRGRLDAAAFGRALDALALRHPVIASRYERDEAGLPQQWVPAAPSIACELIALPDATANEQLEAMERAYRRPIVLAQGASRATVFALGPEQHVVLLTIHHIAVDASSLWTLFDELGQLYAAQAGGAPHALAPPARDHADFVAWQLAALANGDWDAQRDYWRRRLAALPLALELPTDWPRPARRSGNGATFGFTLAPQVAFGLKALARAQGVTPFVLMLAAYGIWLSRITGQDDLVVGVPASGRNQPGFAGIVGFLVNTLPMRVDLSGAPTVAGVVARAQATVSEALRHQDLPFSLLVEQLQPAREGGRTPVFQVCLSYQGAAPDAGLAQGGGAAWGGLRCEPFDMVQQEGQFDLTLNVSDRGDSFGMAIVYSTDLFAPEGAARLAASLTELLGALAGPDGVAALPVAELPLLGASGRRDLFAAMNQTATDYGPFVSLHERIGRRCALAPNATAIEYGEVRLSYAELEFRANRLARHLATLGVGRGALVGVCMERALELPLALYAILKVGAAYVPLDPDYPALRLAAMAEDAQLAVVLTQSHLAGAVPASVRHVLCVEREEAAIATVTTAHIDAAPAVAVTVGVDDLAYVIFTSGTTGRPKGVMNSHGAICNRLLWMAGQYGFTADARFLQKTPFGFDVSVWELFLPLLVGAPLVLARPGGHRDAAYLAQLVAQRRITVAHFVPSMLQVFLEEPGLDACHSLDSVFCSGEALAPATVKRFHQRLGGRLFNLYGPTEAAVDVTHHACPPQAGLAHTVPIGRPVANTEIYILDGRREPVPAGCVGELYIGGVQVARGYLALPELTAERFIDDPFVPGPGRRLYRSGDLARYAVDGAIEYLGRIDQQVKIRGVRIELEEIEAVLAQHDKVADSRVLAVAGPGGGAQLLGFVVARPQCAPAPDALRHFLQQRLPAAMVPLRLHLVASVPVTANGKTDRAALLALDAGAGAVLAGRAGLPQAPRNADELAVAALWQVLLGLDRIDLHDDFFALGGHSLLAAQAVARLRQSIAPGLQLADLLRYPNVAALAARIGALREVSAPAAGAALAALPAGAPKPLSFAQERLWFLWRLAPEQATHNVPLVLRLDGALDAGALELALNMVVARHAALRSRFGAEDGQPRLEILDRLAVPLALHAAPADGPLEALLARLVQQPFDLRADALLRAALVATGPDQHVLALVLHHIVCDGWSLGVLLDEIGAAYPAALAGRAPPFAPLAFEYADYAAWQRYSMRGEAAAADLAFWKGALAGAPALLELPLDRARPALRDGAGGVIPFTLDRHSTERLARMGQGHGCTLFQTLLAALGTLLYRLSGQDDIVIGTPVGARGRAELEPLIGLFVNTVALRTDLAGNPAFSELLGRVRAATLAAFAYQHVPFEAVVEAVAPVRNTSHTPLFQVMLSVQPGHAGRLRLPGVAASAPALQQSIAEFDLIVDLVEGEHGLAGAFVFSSALFEADTVARYAGAFQALLEAFCVDPACALDAVRLWPLAPLAVAAAEAGVPLAHEAIAAAAARSPGAPALVAGDGVELSYAELDARATRLATRLAARLRQAGASAVGLLAHSGIEAIVGLLAILKSGAAYVPLDPALPQARLAWMIADAGVGTLLTNEVLPPLLMGAVRSVLGFDDDGSDAGACGFDAAPAPVARGATAYIIYTSGSSGTPKGVAVSHGALAAHCHSMGGVLGLGTADRVLQFASLSFDVSLEQIVPTLMAGAALVLRGDRIWSASGFAAQVARQRITVADLPPAYLREVLHEWPRHGVAALQLRLVLAGGDVLEAGTLGLWQRAGMAGVRLLNAYGPTEATITALVCEVGAGGEPLSPGGRVPIGRALPGRRAYIVDAAGQLCAPGVPGELCLAGAGLALGYVERPRETAAAFAPDPFCDQPGQRMYRTGDRARQLRSGALEFLGRIDGQVKLRGFRIELGEIDAALNQVAGVRAGAAALQDGQRLLACVVAHEGMAGTLAGAVEAHLAATLPNYMQPHVVLLVAQLPLTVRGKIDRAALCALAVQATQVAAGAPAPAAAPSDALEAALAAIWREVLGRAEVGVGDSFFGLGGHSLLALRLMARVEHAFGIDLPLASLMRDPTLGGQAALLRGAQEAPGSPLHVLNGIGGTGAAVPQAGRPLLVLVHGAAGGLLSYGELVAGLVGALAVVGLQAPGLDGAPAAATLAELAGAYLAHAAPLLARHRAAGPVYLGGWSFGGVVAQEMARQLELQGQAIDAVLLIDSYAPAALPHSGARDAALLGLAIAQAGLADAGDEPGVAQRLGRLHEVYHGNDALLAHHVPAPCAAPLLLLQAAVGAQAGVGAGQHGWDGLSGAGVRVCAVPGDHFSMLQGDHARALAAAVAHALTGCARGAGDGQ